MRAYQLPKGGAGIEALVQVERPDPKPGHRQVLVKVKACSLNFRDLGIVRGSYRMPVRDNVIPLSDGAGEVIEIGPGVTRVKVGDRVAGNFFQRWQGGEPVADVHTSALGGSIDGMLADYALLEEAGAVKIPPHLSLEEGATLPCAGVTAWHAMMEHAKLKAGDTILLQGTGGVSIFGLQFAHAMGIRAIVTSSSDEKLKRAKALGAALGINYKTTPDWDKAALEFTGGAGVDHVVEVGGAATLTKATVADPLATNSSVTAATTHLTSVQSQASPSVTAPTVPSSTARRSAGRRASSPPAASPSPAARARCSAT